MPAYELHAYGRLSDMLPATAQPSPIYVLVWIADLSSIEPGHGAGGPVIGLIGRAYGATGSRRAVAVAMVRTGTDTGPPQDVRLLWWHELQ
jgi:hypothetical protein